MKSNSQMSAVPLAARVNASFLPSRRDPRLHHLALERSATSRVCDRPMNHANSRSARFRRRPDDRAVGRDAREVAALAFLDAHVGRDRPDVSGRAGRPDVERLREQFSVAHPEQHDRAAVAGRRIQAARQRGDQPHGLASFRRATEIDAVVLRPTAADEEQEVPAAGQRDRPVVRVLVRGWRPAR